MVLKSYKNEILCQKLIFGEKNDFFIKNEKNQLFYKIIKFYKNIASGYKKVKIH